MAFTIGFAHHLLPASQPAQSLPKKLPVKLGWEWEHTESHSVWLFFITSALHKNSQIKDNTCQGDISSDKKKQKTQAQTKEQFPRHLPQDYTQKWRMTVVNQRVVNQRCGIQ